MIELVTRSRNPWSILDELESLQSDMNRWLGGRGAYWRKGTTSYPPMNVWSSPEGLLMDIEMPGVDAKDVDISVIGDELTLKGKVNVRELKKGVAYLRRERPTGEFSRTLKLPFRVETGAVKASYRNGVLRLSVPRAQEEKPRKITVEA